MSVFVVSLFCRLNNLAKCKLFAGAMITAGAIVDSVSGNGKTKKRKMKIDCRTAFARKEEPLSHESRRKMVI